MIKRSALIRQIAAALGLACCLIALAFLWQLRPAFPPLRSAPIHIDAIRSLIQGLLWLTLVALTLALLARCLRPGRPPEGRTAPPRAGRSPQRRPNTTNRAPILDSAEQTRASTKPTAAKRYLPPWQRPRFTVTPASAERAAAAAASQAAALVEPDRERVATRQSEAQTRPRVLLLGSLAIPSEGGRRRRALGPAHELIAYLALHPEGAARDQLLEALWPNESPRRSEQRLWQATKEARKLLHDAIVRDSGRYRLDRQRVDVDTDELEQLLAQVDEATDELSEHELLERALALFRGRPLEGSDFLWADGVCRRLAGLHLELLSRVADSRLRTCDARGALDAAEQGIAADSLNESFWRIALRAEAAGGSREAIAARYEQLTKLLEERLGLRPDRETRNLYRQLLSQQ
jgi:DNA-binding SARP family transcriptional activator